MAVRIAQLNVKPMTYRFLKADINAEDCDTTFFCGGDHLRSYRRSATVRKRSG